MAINLVQKPQGGGILGAIGSVLGAIGGGIATVVTGGAALPLVAAGASVGKTAGAIGDAAINKQDQPKGVGEFNVVQGKPQMGAADVIGKAGDVLGAANSISSGVDKLLGGDPPPIGGAIGRKALSLGANTSLGEDPSLALSRQLQNIKRRF